MSTITKVGNCLSVLLQTETTTLTFNISRGLADMIETHASVKSNLEQWKNLTMSLIKPNAGKELNQTITLYNCNGHYCISFDFEASVVTIQSYHFGIGLSITIPIEKSIWLEICGHMIALCEN